MDKSKIEKPASVAKEELTATIINAVNNCGLPAFVITPILRDVLEQMRKIEVTQYEKDKEEYEKKLKEAKENERGKKELGEKEKDALIRHAEETMSES